MELSDDDKGKLIKSIKLDLQHAATSISSAAYTMLQSGECEAWREEHRLTFYNDLEELSRVYRLLNKVIRSEVSENLLNIKVMR
jgi:hypothetical protein